MRWTPTLFALALLIALSLVTASLNVWCTHYGYRLGQAMQHSSDLQQMIAFRRAQVREMLTTADLAKWAREQGAPPEQVLTNHINRGHMTALALGGK